MPVGFEFQDVKDDIKQSLGILLEEYFNDAKATSEPIEVSLEDFIYGYAFTRLYEKVGQGFDLENSVQFWCGENLDLD